MAHVLWIAENLGQNYDPNAPGMRLLAAAQVAAVGYGLYAGCSVYPPGQGGPGPLPASPPPCPPSPPGRASAWAAGTGSCWGPSPWPYGLVAFWQLETIPCPRPAGTPQQGQQVVLEADSPVEELLYLPGAHRGQPGLLLPGGDQRPGGGKRRRPHLDGLRLPGGGLRVHLDQLPPVVPGRYVRLTALDGSVVLNEVALKRQGYQELAALTLEAGEGEALVDEQDLAPPVRHL